MKSKKTILTAISAGLLLLGLYPLKLTALSLFAFLPLFMLLFDASTKRRDKVICSLFVGMIYYAIGLYWLILFDPKIYVFAFLCVAPTFALYFFILGLITSKLNNDSIKILTASSLWILIQKVYALSPISTIATEVPFYGPAPFFQIASIFSYVAVSALIIGLNAALALFIKKRTVRTGLWIVVFFTVLCGIYLWGNKRVQSQGRIGEVQFAVVQHNFPVSGKWRLEHPVFIRSEYRRMALEAAKQKPDMIIFPLYSFPDDALRSPEFFNGLAQETQTWILVATYIPQNPGESITRGFFDAALLYSPEGKLIDHYQAVQAPPFRGVSEYTNKEYKVLNSPFGKLGILLCYEDALPEMSKRAVLNGAEILIALSNPGHFSSTHMPYYHLMQDRLRAIESNRWIVRASANGYSALVDPKGRFVQKSELNKQETLYVKVGKEQGITSYQRSLDWLTISCSLVLLVILLFGSRASLQPSRRIGPAAAEARA